MSPIVIAVFGGKGGIGKTTSTLNFAWQFGADGHRTLLVDANVDQPSAHDIYQGLKDDPPYDLTMEEDPALLSRIKSAPYDRVVIDCPPSPREAQPGLDAADYVVVPFVPKFLETKAIARTIKNTLDGRPYRVLFVAVTNHMNGRQGRAAQTRETLAGFNVPLFEAVVRHYAAHEKSQANGIPLFLPEAAGLDDNMEKAASDYRAAYKELLGYLPGGK
jgi:chromosome partitioning protein